MRRLELASSFAKSFRALALVPFLVAMTLNLTQPRIAKADTVLITGANSGIGLEFARQYAAKGWTVIATHRRAETPRTLADLAAT
jgi:NADPH:quinone reductase-like Zn-dependent oxidoreductase